MEINLKKPLQISLLPVILIPVRLREGPVSKYIAKNSERIKNWPEWVGEFAFKYGSKTANLYIVHGNIRDFLPKENEEGEFIFALIQQYIAEIIFGNIDIIAYYDRSDGVSFCTDGMAA